MIGRSEILFCKSNTHQELVPARLLHLISGLLHWQNSQGQAITPVQQEIEQEKNLEQFGCGRRQHVIGVSLTTLEMFGGMVTSLKLDQSALDMRSPLREVHLTTALPIR